jgi:hypothetical protein
VAGAAQDVADIKQLMGLLRPPGSPPGKFNFGINGAPIEAAIHARSHTAEWFRVVASRMRYAYSTQRVEFLAHEVTEIMADWAMNRLP